MYKRIISKKGGPSFLCKEAEAREYLASGDFLEVAPPKEEGEYRPYGNRMAEVARQVESCRRVRPEDEDIWPGGPGPAQTPTQSVGEILQESDDLERDE
jgi:hypothetical protein